jgi:hypothetical protein
MLRSKYRKFTKFSYELSKLSNSYELKFINSIDSYKSYDDNEFTFLNVLHKFKDSIDWNFSEHGKLWTYNLNYFEYLNQKDFSKDIGLELINDFIDNIEKSKDGLEPFPNSLRGINWIKFLSFNKIEEKKIDDSLYAQYYILLDTLEYHILGNHLLENGFSLLFGAYYFNDEVLFKKAKKILVTELNEEILPDGGHYELSPMYHQLMLFRVLDCLNLVQNNNHIKDDMLNSLLYEKAVIMLSWLDQISYKDGSIPHFNDSADHIAPTTDKLFDYAKRLGVETTKKIALKESGYRVFNKDNYELRVDVGEIGPSYIPGHAHSDTFNFELRVNGKPFIVDTGISTYETNNRRLQERQTSSHNTVQIGNIEQSKVWSSFRVANRAHIIDLKESANSVEASHDGYKDLGVIHKRVFTSYDKSIEINDLLIGQVDKNLLHTAYIHFHPEINNIEILENKVTTQDVILTIKGSKNLQLDDFTFANGFNKVEISKVLKITFDNELLVEIAFDKQAI